MNNLSIKKNFLLVSLFSLVTALLAYLLVFFAGNYASIYFAYDFDIGSWFNLGGVDFAIDKSNSAWTYDAEVTILLARPLLSLVIGIMSLLLLIIVNRINIILFLFLLWINIFAFNAALGLFVNDFILRSGVFFVARRMELGNPVMIFSLAVTVFLMYRLGMVNSMVFAQILPKKCNTHAVLKAFLVLLTIIIPWILTSIIVIVISYPNFKLLEHLKTISTFIIIIPFFYCKAKDISNSFHKVLKINYYDWIILVVMVLLIIFLFFKMQNSIVISG